MDIQKIIRSLMTEFANLWLTLKLTMRLLWSYCTLLKHKSDNADVVKSIIDSDKDALKKSFVKCWKLSIVLLLFLLLVGGLDDDASSDVDDVGNDGISMHGPFADEWRIDVDVPIKSICGFVFGSTINQCRELLDDAKESCTCMYGVSRTLSAPTLEGRLKKPFRNFTRAVLVFTPDKGEPKHLCCVWLYSDYIDTETIQKESCNKEILKVKEILEDKYDIDLAPEHSWAPGYFTWYSKKKLSKGGSAQWIKSLVYIDSDRRLQLEIMCPLVEERDDAAREEQKKDISF